MRRLMAIVALVASLSVAVYGAGTGETKEAASAAPVELTMAFLTFANVPKDLPLVQEEINKIIAPKIGATLKLLPINIGSWGQQINLMLAGGEGLDLLVTGTSPTLNYSVKAVNGQIIPLNDLLNTYGQGIIAALGTDYVKAGEVNGKIYGVATIRDLAQSMGLVMRKDILDKHKIDYRKIKTFDDAERLFKTIKEKEPDLIPTMPGNSSASMVDYMRTFDPLGEGFGVLPNNGAGTKVVNWAETPEYRADLNRVRAWYESGYILKDVATNKDHPSVFIKANKLFSYFAVQKPGLAAQESKMSKTELVMAEIVAPMSATSSVANIMWSIPRNSKNPEKAMQFLNLMYTDPVIVNLLDWGIEGKHYVKLPDGRIDYPQGVDVSNTGYSMNLGWEFGNQFLSYIWNGDPPDLWKELDAFNKRAKRSKAMGFTFDVSAVKSEIAAVTNVQNQYKMGLENGMLNPEPNLTAYQEKLRAAGVDKIIAEKQRQLDLWSKK